MVAGFACLCGCGCFMLVLVPSSLVAGQGLSKHVQVNVLMLFLVVITDLKRAGLMPGDKNRIYTNIFLHRISAKIFQVYAAVRKQVYRQKAN